jgi:hypothetical protein
LLKKQTNEVGAVNKTAKSLKTFVPLLVWILQSTAGREALNRVWMEMHDLI